MGIRFACPNGHKLNVKEHLAGKRGICPNCGAKFTIPAASESNGGTTLGPPSVAATKSDFAELTDAPMLPDAGSVSVVIPVVEPPLPALEQPSTPTAPPNIPTSAPPEIHITTSSPAPAIPAPPPVLAYAARRERRRRLQMKIAAALFVAVILLAIVLAWVLSRGPAEPASASMIRSAWGREEGIAAQPWSTTPPVMMASTTIPITTVE